MKKTINLDFFKNWTRDSAYIIGYICADGCIHKRTNRKNSYVLTITSKDKDHLEKINVVLQSNYAISTKRGGSDSVAYHIAISNSKICFDLIAKGVFPRKTFTLDTIDVPKHLFADFIRGFFDADGSVYIYIVNGTPQLKTGFVSASKNFMQFISEKITTNLMIPLKPIHYSLRKGKYHALYSIVFYVNDGEKLFNFMYRNNPRIFMDRKFEVFKKWNSTKRRRYTFTDR